jgi:hypothetical protein
MFIPKAGVTNSLKIWWENYYSAGEDAYQGSLASVHGNMRLTTSKNGGGMFASEGDIVTQLEAGQPRV